MSTAKSQYSLSDLSARFELHLIGDGDVVIDGVGTLMSAGPSQVSFLANRAYLKELPTTGAGAVILRKNDAESCPVNCLVAEDPYLAYARLAALFDARPAAAPGIHPSAVISPSSTLGKNVSIGALVTIGDDCVIEAGCTIGPGSVLEPSCRLGEGYRLFANVSLGHGVKLGKRVMLHPGVVIGADGFGIAFAKDHWEKVPQLGAVRIGDDCEIGANSCIDRGAIEDTVLEEDVRIDNLCQIGHNAHIGAHTAIAGTSAIGGTARIGSYCLLAGGAGIAGHIEIADRTTISAGSLVFKSILEPGTTWSSQFKAQPIRDWQRSLVRLKKLDELANKIQSLEKQLGKATENE
jgi:UDP-3-O-[3-hydroxymyristoyl] glucosamine N-acyltransferase